MNVFIRVDSSLEIGSGHLMRCLTLADLLRQKGCVVSFICRELPGNLCHIAEGKGFTVYRLPYKEAQRVEYTQQPLHAYWLGVDWELDAKETIAVLAGAEGSVDWLIADHYALDNRWESRVWPHAHRIMVIDDLADRHHECNLLVDQNFYESFGNRYDELVPNDCRKLLGPKYALLRREFAEARKGSRQRNGNIQHILIFFGGSDLTNETTKALEAVGLIDRPDLGVDVIIGVNNPNRYDIESVANTMSQATSHFHVDNMAELMAAADLYIGAAGITTWERCCLGLPSMIITVAQNQVQAIKDMANHNLLCYVGENSMVDACDIVDRLEYFLKNPLCLKQYSLNSMSLIDGLGSERCLNVLFDNE